jgi:hypothetical protein
MSLYCSPLPVGPAIRRSPAHGDAAERKRKEGHPPHARPGECAKDAQASRGRSVSRTSPHFRRAPAAEACVQHTFPFYTVHRIVGHTTRCQRLCNALAPQARSALMIASVISR